MSNVTVMSWNKRGDMIIKLPYVLNQEEKGKCETIKNRGNIKENMAIKRGMK